MSMIFSGFVTTGLCDMSLSQNTQLDILTVLFLQSCHCFNFMVVGYQAGQFLGVAILGLSWVEWLLEPTAFVNRHLRDPLCWERSGVQKKPSKQMVKKVSSVDSQPAQLFITAISIFSIQLLITQAYSAQEDVDVDQNVLCRAGDCKTHSQKKANVWLFFCFFLASLWPKFVLP